MAAGGITVLDKKLNVVFSSTDDSLLDYSDKRIEDIVTIVR